MNVLTVESDTPQEGNALGQTPQEGNALGQQTARDVQAEAVAYLVIENGCGHLVHAGEHPELADERNAEPLYFAAPPASDVQAVPGTYTQAMLDQADREALALAKKLGIPTDEDDVQPVGAVADERAVTLPTLPQTIVEDLREIGSVRLNSADLHRLLHEAVLFDRAAAPALQGESGATFAEGIEAAAKLADWSAPHVARNIRALAPQPTTGATVADQRDAAHQWAVRYCPHSDGGGHLVQHWVIERGEERIENAAGRRKRFKSEAAAQKACDALNAAQDAAGEQS